MIQNKAVIFWDFDGVIKDSVEVKSCAYEQLFEEFGSEVSKKIRVHHEVNGGMSRFDKFPIYLEWSDQQVSQTLVNEYSEKFSKLVKQSVIESEWVAGVAEYLKKNARIKTFFLVTATPQSEIEEILSSLKIGQYFQKVIGSPTNKGDAIKSLLGEYSIKLNEAVMIGDSSSDYEAASANHVPFILRRTNLNHELQKRLDCPMIKDFCNE